MNIWCCLHLMDNIDVMKALVLNEDVYVFRCLFTCSAARLKKKLLLFLPPKIWSDFKLQRLEANALSCSLSHKSAFPSYFWAPSYKHQHRGFAFKEMNNHSLPLSKIADKPQTALQLGYCSFISLFLQGVKTAGGWEQGSAGQRQGRGVWDPRAAQPPASFVERVMSVERERNWCWKRMHTNKLISRQTRITGFMGMQYRPLGKQIWSTDDSGG